MAKTTKTTKARRKKPLHSPNARRDREFERITLARSEDEGLVLVWLDRFGFALMREADHEKVKEVTGRDFVNYYANMDDEGRAYVYAPPRVGSGKKHLVVAHIVAGAKEGQKAKCRDGNTFDLRPDNWDVTGKAKTLPPVEDWSSPTQRRP